MGKVYHYEIGVKELQPYRRVYSAVSAYVSKPFTVEGTIASISLECKDAQGRARNEHTDQFYLPTSIEYYITAVDNPSPDQWIPILPKGIESVENEKLFIVGGQGFLRFNCNVTKPMTVYMNTVPLDSSLWDIAIRNNKMCVVLDNTVDTTQSFTIDYIPDSAYTSPWDIPIERLIPNSVIEQSLKYKTDTFKGTDLNGVVALSKYPYLNISNSSSFNNKVPLAVYLTDADISGPRNTVITSCDPLEGTPASGKAYTKNITEYSQANWNTKEYTIKPYDSVNNAIFEYYHKGNKVVFGETFTNSSNVANSDYNHGDATIVITYQYLATNLRFKAIFRQNGLHDNALTPMLYEYRINVELAK